MHARRRAFTLLELLVCMVVAAAFIAVFLAAHEPRRRLASLQESFNNLREIGAAYGSYAHENQDRIATFTWVGGVQSPSTFPDLRGPFVSDGEAAAAQLADILRRRGIPQTTTFPRLTSFSPHLRYSHLVLSDFMGLNGVWWSAIGPEDVNLRRWANNPDAFLTGQSPPQPSSSTTMGGARWLFSTSYHVTASAYSPDSGSSAPGPASNYGSSTIPSGSSWINVWGRRRFDEVAFPAQKIHRYDEAQRHFGARIALFAYPEARVPVLAFDGATSLRVARDNDRGFNPRSPLSPNPVFQQYVPESWQPPTIDGQSTVNPGMQWTRDGLRGRDFDR